jgi:hypothetical protein
MKLSRDFKEFVASLNAEGVRYLIVGGYAVAAHGHPRYTKDLDVWLEVSSDNAKRTVAALAQFGFENLGLREEDFLEPGVVVQLGHPPQRIDLMTTASGVSFDECYAARMEFEIDGVRVPFINVDHLLRNKRAVGRPQDHADIEALGGKPA